MTQPPGSSFTRADLLSGRATLTHVLDADFQRRAANDGRTACGAYYLAVAGLACTLAFSIAFYFAEPWLVLGFDARTASGMLVGLSVCASAYGCFAHRSGITARRNVEESTQWALSVPAAVRACAAGWPIQVQIRLRNGQSQPVQDELNRALLAWFQLACAFEDNTAALRPLQDREILDCGEDALLRMFRFAPKIDGLAEVAGQRNERAKLIANALSRLKSTNEHLEELVTSVHHFVLATAETDEGLRQRSTPVEEAESLLRNTARALDDLG